MLFKLRCGCWTADMEGAEPPINTLPVQKAMPPESPAQEPPAPRQLSHPPKPLDLSTSADVQQSGKDDDVDGTMVQNSYEVALSETQCHPDNDWTIPTLPARRTASAHVSYERPVPHPPALQRHATLTFTPHVPPAATQGDPDVRTVDLPT